MIKGMHSALRGCGKWLAVSIATTALSCALAPAAHAGQVDTVSAGVSSGSFYGSPLDLTRIGGPGVLSVKVYDVGTPGTIAPPLEGLSFSVYDSSSIFSHAGGGQLDVDISGPGMFYLNVNAIPSQSLFALGMISWKATFEANSVVPLPASVWLLIAGLAWATGMQRKRAKLAH